MAVTHRPRKRPMPYKTRLTGRLIFLRSGFSSGAALRFVKKTRLEENEGFGAARRTPRHLEFVMAGRICHAKREMPD
jgi:hypothetical protein